MIKATITACLCVLLVACAQHKWNKYGATNQDFVTDSYECERDRRQSGGFGTGLLGALAANDFQNRCLEARGWRLEVVDIPTSPTVSEYHQPIVREATYEDRAEASTNCIKNGINPGTKNYYTCFTYTLSAVIAKRIGSSSSP